MILAKRTNSHVAERLDNFSYLARLDLDRHCRYQHLFGYLDDRDGDHAQWRLGQKSAAVETEPILVDRILIAASLNGFDLHAGDPN